MPQSKRQNSIGLVNKLRQIIHLCFCGISLTTVLRLVFGSFFFFFRYAMTGQINQKSDVYSFGVILLELLTGRKPVDHTMPKGQQSLVTWVISYLLFTIPFLKRTKENFLMTECLANHVSRPLQG